jgi:hypothetical protein
MRVRPVIMRPGRRFEALRQVWTADPLSSTEIAHTLEPPSETVCNSDGLTGPEHLRTRGVNQNLAAGPYAHPHPAMRRRQRAPERRTGCAGAERTKLEAAANLPRTMGEVIKKGTNPPRRQFRTRWSTQLINSALLCVRAPL